MNEFLKSGFLGINLIFKLFENGLQADPCYFWQCILRLFYYLYFFQFYDWIGIRGHRTIPKVISTTLFLYFACILPSIAFGVLNGRNTKGQIGKLARFVETGNAMEVYVREIDRNGTNTSWIVCFLIAVVKNLLVGFYIYSSIHLVIHKIYIVRNIKNFECIEHVVIAGSQ